MKKLIKTFQIFLFDGSLTNLTITSMPKHFIYGQNNLCSLSLAWLTAFWAHLLNTSQFSLWSCFFWSALLVCWTGLNPTTRISMLRYYTTYEPTWTTETESNRCWWGYYCCFLLLLPVFLMGGPKERYDKRIQWWWWWERIKKCGTPCAFLLL